MRYVILGAGAIGGALGGRLADAGHDVLFLARGEHAATLRRDGLTLEVPERTLHIRVPVADDPGALALQRGDVLLLTVKSQQTHSLLDEVAGLPVGQGSSRAADTIPIVCMQNGVENERAALRRFARVYGSCVVCAAEHLRPGVVVASGAPFTGCFDTGRYPDGVDEVVESLTRAVASSACIATARAQIMPWKYAKLLRNLANALDALGGDDLDGAQRAEADQLGRRAREEGRRCLEAAGIETVSEQEWSDYRFGEAASHPVGGHTRSGSSSWQSVSRGTGNVEADYLNGEIALLGRLHGVPTPINALLQREVNALAARGGHPGDVTPSQLTALAT